MSQTPELIRKHGLRYRREVTGMDLLKFWGKCAAFAVGIWLLLVVWPLLERGSR